MKRKRFTEEQISYALRQAEGGTPVAEICRKLQVALPDIIPGGRPLAAAWANCYASPWATAALLAAGAGLAVYALISHPPRKG